MCGFIYLHCLSFTPFNKANSDAFHCSPGWEGPLLPPCCPTPCPAYGNSIYAAGRTFMSEDALHSFAATSTSDRRKNDLVSNEITPQPLQNTHNLPIFSTQAPRYPQKRHCCHFGKCKRTVQKETGRDARGCAVRPARRGREAAAPRRRSRAGAGRLGRAGNGRGTGDRSLHKSKKRPCPRASRSAKIGGEVSSRITCGISPLLLCCVSDQKKGFLCF